MSSFSTWMIIGIVILTIFLLISGPVETSCPEDAKVCLNGSVVYRDPLNDCEFYPCLNEELYEYCTDNIESVESSGEYIKTVSSLVGAGFTVYYNDEEVYCPLVSPGMMSSECRAFLSMDWGLTIDCT